MKLLVLVADYPKPDDYISMMFVHVRNQYYVKHNIDVTVLNFKANENYIVDNIPVITLQEYLRNRTEKKYDILVCHAPNIRNHYRFLKKNERYFPKIVFFFHGHEVLKINSVYPKPYPYKKKSFIKNIFQDIYDDLKLKLWRGYFKKLTYKSHFVFVSKWLYKEFLRWTKINDSVINGKYSIIHNSVGKVFEEKHYEPKIVKQYDFISIRGNLDGSKYCVDIINELAMNNPDLRFLIIGRGEFFDHFKKAKNVTWIDKVLKHEEMIKFLNQSKCGLLLTRQDTQGVMTCEMATFGLPVITSDIAVCHEILDDFDNVELINNDNTNIDLKPILEKLIKGIPYKKNEKYFSINTCGAEVKLYKNLLRE